MSHLFYHGFEPYGDLSESVKHMMNITNCGGIKLRNESRGNDDKQIASICLYRKKYRF